MRALLATLLVVTACRGPLADAGDAADSAPVSGPWSAGLFGFVLGDGRIDRVELTGLGCSGPRTAAGEPVCDSLLRGETELTAAVDPASRSFRVTTSFGLTLEGRFVAGARAEGTFHYVADNGCCASEGAWEAVPSSPGSDGPLPCQSVLTGAERLDLGVTADHASGSPSFEPLAPGDPIAAVPGFQGALMLVPAVRTEDLAAGGLSLEVTVALPETGVTGRIVSKFNELNEQGALEWSGLYVILEHPDTGALAPGDPEDRARIDGQRAALTATLRSECGLELARTIDVTVVVKE